MTGAQLVSLIEGHRLRASSERQLQQALAELFVGAHVAFEREVSLTTTDRVDFLVGRVGLEVKVDGSLTMVTRQLHRYAQSTLVDELVLVTTRVQQARLPAEIAGKRIHVAALMGLI